MKQAVTFLFLILFVCTGCTYNFTNNDCVEDGICKEGLSVNIDGESFIITKESCISHNKKWNNKNSTCFMR